ncbi:phospholipase D-like domain-containing protein [Flindersiella endophytica]
MRPRELIRGIALAAAAIVVAVITACQPPTTNAGQAKEPKEDWCHSQLPGLDGTYTEVFNNPHSSDPQDQVRISCYIQSLINDMDSGEITIATYRFLDGDLRHNLSRAVGRGVKVKVLLNGSAKPDSQHPVPWKCEDGVGEDSEEYCKLKKEIGGNRSADSWISYCGAGQPKPLDADTCIGGRTPNYKSSWPIMHNKFYLFSKTMGKSNVVVQTTSNLSESSGPDMFNTALAIAGKPELYKAYQDYFADLAKEDRDPEYYEHNKPVRIDGRLELNFSPRQNGNTVLGYLNRVDCPKKGKQTRVRVAAADIRGGTGAEIAKKLWELDNDGCYVDIAADLIGYGEYSKPRTDPLRRLLKQPTGKYHGPDVREFSKHRKGVHEKNLLIDGQFDGKDQKVVFTGSLNFNNKSRYANDEIWLMVIDDEVHDEFRKNFWDIRECANLVWQASSPDRYWETPTHMHKDCPKSRK